MLRVRELDKEMSGEDRFHLENISFHLPKGYICGPAPAPAPGPTPPPRWDCIGQQET